MERLSRLPLDELRAELRSESRNYSVSPK
jgi:hypothetical protein